MRKPQKATKVLNSSQNVDSRQVHFTSSFCSLTFERINHSHTNFQIYLAESFAIQSDHLRNNYITRSPTTLLFMVHCFDPFLASMLQCAMCRYVTDKHCVYHCCWSGVSNRRLCLRHRHRRPEVLSICLLTLLDMSQLQVFCKIENTSRPAATGGSVISPKCSSRNSWSFTAASPQSLSSKTTKSADDPTTG